MAIEEYPGLAALSKDLARLEERERQRDARDRRKRLQVIDGVNCAQVEYGGRSFWVTGPQQKVIRMLLDAAGSRNPDVSQAALIKVSGVDAERLADVFGGGNEAWDALIARGKQAGTYRLQPTASVLPQAELEGEERRIVPPED